jgi:hypothetical protein
MTIYDTELTTSLAESHIDFSISTESSDFYFDLLNDRFPVEGTQIKWSGISLFYKKLNDLSIVEEFIECIEIIKNRYRTNIVTESICYIGDSLTELAYKLSFESISQFFQIAKDIPHHHYFLNINATWCISISMTNDFNFGVSLNNT